MVNLNEYKSIGTQSTALYVNGTDFIYSDSFGVEHISRKKINKQQKDKNKCLQNTSKCSNNMWILLYWIYWFHAKT